VLGTNQRTELDILLILEVYTSFVFLYSSRPELQPKKRSQGLSKDTEAIGNASSEGGKKKSERNPSGRLVGPLALEGQSESLGQGLVAGSGLVKENELLMAGFAD
jgi:hypothetical protein